MEEVPQIPHRVPGSFITAVYRPMAKLPLAPQSGQLALSLGCIGNRVYTGLADDEACVAIPGASLGKLVAQLAGVAKANVELEKFHQARARA